MFSFNSSVSNLDLCFFFVDPDLEVDLELEVDEDELEYRVDFFRDLSFLRPLLDRELDLEIRQEKREKNEIVKLSEDNYYTNRFRDHS